MFPVDNYTIKFEYNERLKAAELARRSRKSPKATKGQIKETISTWWKQLSPAAPAKPALRTK